jgi:hypothetical protein
MEYRCNDCNKAYKSYQSLWNHNKKFHTTIGQVKSDFGQVKSDFGLINYEGKKYQCRKCNKIYFNKQSRWSHEHKCNKKENELEIEKVKLEQIKEELKIKQEENNKLKEESKLIKLKIKLQNTKKLDAKTFKTLNKMLMDRSHKNITNNTTINNINNYFNISGFGKEDILDVLSYKEKKNILNQKYNCLNKLIEITNCGNYNNFKNIIITNLKDNYAYKYDDKLGYFIAGNKNEICSDLINNRVMDIEAIYDELSTANKIDDKTKEIIQTFLDKIGDEGLKFTDNENNIIYPNYKDYKINQIKILLYNNQDKITKDISLVFSTDIE